MEPGQKDLRLLVVIASYGEKNIKLLKRIIDRYQNMTFHVDVVVVSEAPKDLGSSVEVLVGLPTKDPWSLPFAHKAVLGRKLEDYDLFAYSEDDMEVTEQNIRAFLRITPLLAQDEIAGFLRYEDHGSGKRWLPDVHAYYRWNPESVRRRQSVVVAEFTNEHSAFYLLTREQLRRAIASGGFISAPNKGRHDLACTAATDPYTRCGFRKVVCISELDDFLIHHASNRYAGTMGLSLDAFREQLQALLEIGEGARPAKTLCAIEPNAFHVWSKNLYEKPGKEWIDAVPKEARNVLTIGCGWGDFEAELLRRGVSVTALAMDSVLGAHAERLGLEVINGTLEEGFNAIKTRQFDCVVMSHLLHLLPAPAHVIKACANLVKPGGVLLLSGPNFNRFPVFVRRTFQNGDYGKLRSFADSGINVWNYSDVSTALGRIDFKVGSVRWLNHLSLLGGGQKPALELGGMTACDWMVAAKRR